MARNKISTAVREKVARRASGCCEYCHASERWQYVRFTIDHVVPRDRGGTDDGAIARVALVRGRWMALVAEEPDSRGI